MKEIKFRAWHHTEKRMYYRGYQKFFYVLLCDDDRGQNQGRGTPVRRAAYGQCTFLESTGLVDKNHREIYEGDILRLSHEGRTVVALAGPVPDSFGSGKVHPLRDLFAKHGIPQTPENLEIEVLGNEYENPELLQ